MPDASVPNVEMVNPNSALEVVIVSDPLNLEKMGRFQ
jgi:hypothetical protein